jgi:hypothetical protein
VWSEADGRHAVTARAERMCEADPSHEGTHWHHRVLRGQGGTWSPVNGMWVCAAAHDWIHKHPADALALGWLVASTVDPATAPVWLHRPWEGWWLLSLTGEEIDPRAHVLVPLDGVPPAERNHRCEP